MTCFLLATLFYRLANGLLFLSVAWNLVRGNDAGAMSLAISSVAGFLPAVLIAPLAKRLLQRIDSLKLTMAGIALLLLLSLALIPFLKLPTAVLVINFAVLLIFFLLEGAWDTLLATIAMKLPQAQSDALNARQSAATQAGLMLGGLPLGLLTRIGGPSLPFQVSAVLYLIAIALLLLLPLFVKSRSGTSAVGAMDSMQGKAGGETPVSWYVLVILAMVWPCLTLVNIAVPLLANAHGNGTVEHAAMLDAAFGLGMAFSGLAYGRYNRIAARQRLWLTLACTVFIPLPFLWLQVMGYLLWPLALCFFLSGAGFGLFRINVRKLLIATQPTHQVGQIVFTCNAYGFPVLTALAFMYAMTWAHGPAVPLTAFGVFAFTGALMVLMHRGAVAAVQPQAQSALIDQATPVK